MLSVTCEEFAIALDKQFGAKLWSECPDVANKGNYVNVCVWWVYGERALELSDATVAIIYWARKCTAAMVIV